MKPVQDKRGGTIRSYMPIVTGALICTAQLLGAPPAGLSLGESPTQLAGMLGELRPDYRQFVREIRRLPGSTTPAGHYMALVRPEGNDPLDPDDTPEAGPEVRNDIIFYFDSFELDRTPAWRLLLLDHEYLHAKHLGGGHQLPLVSFGSQENDRHFYEAAAWGFNVTEAIKGIYGPLSDREWAEVRSNHIRHRNAFRKMIERRQPSAWAYYSQLFPEIVPEINPAKP